MLGYTSHWKAKAALGLLISSAQLLCAQFTFLPSDSYLLSTLCQGQSIDHCISVSSAGNNHAIQSFSGNDGPIVIAPPSSPYDTCFRYTASFGFTGFDTVDFVIANNLGQTDILEIVFKIVNPNTPIDAGPNQQLCSVNTTTLSAVNPDPLATGFWTVIGGTGILTSPNSPTTTVTNLSLGTNSFLWHQNYPCDANFDLIQVFRYTGTPPVANAGPDAFLCSGTTYTMQANSPGVSATGTWEITCGNASINNINSASAQVSNIGLGVNCFEWNIDNGPCPGGESVDQMFIYVYNQNHPAANAGPDQNLCSTGLTSITLSGNVAQLPATAQWTQVSGPNTANILSPASPTTSVNGIVVGQYVFQYTINNGPCGSLTDQIIVNVFPGTQAAANAGPDQQLCLPANNTTLAANSVTFPAVGTWTVISGTGSFANLNSPTTTVSGLSTGTNTFRWTINNGPCPPSTTFDNVSIIIYPNSQNTANAGPDQSLCFNGTPLSTTLNGSSVTSPGTGTWSQISGPNSANFSSVVVTNPTVSNLIVGQYTFQWNVNNGPCPGGGSNQVLITIYNNSITLTNAGPDGTLCTPTTSWIMAATAPTFPATGSWSTIAGAGTFANSSSPTSLVTNLALGTNTFRWTINNGACGSSVFDDVTITVFNNTQAAANAGPDLEQCFNGTSPGTMTVAANLATFPATGTWTLVSSTGPPNPVITSPSIATTTITNLFVGTYVFQWTINNGACGSTSDQMTVFIYSPSQTAANAGADQQICSTTPSVNLSANPLIPPATGVWTVLAGTGTFTPNNGSNTTVTGMSIGTNTYLWTIDNGPCATPSLLSDAMNLTVFNAAQTPAAAGADQNICSTTTTVTLTGNTPLFPATGQWIVISGTGTFGSPTSPVTAVTGMSVGCNLYQWSINNGPCSPITTDQVTVCVNDVNAPPANAGIDIDQCVPNLSVNLNGNTPVFPATGLWTLISGSGVMVDNDNPNTLVTGLGMGPNIFQWTINNGACNQITSDQVVVTIFANDLTGADAGPDAELCTPTSTYVMQATAVALPAYGNWTLISGTGSISSIVNPNASITGLTIGENIFRWTIFNGPCPGGSDFDEMSIFVFDQNQDNAGAGPDQSFCFNGINPINAIMNGSEVTSPGSGVWTIVQGGGNLQDAGNANTQITGIPVGINIYQWTVDNGPCANSTTSDQVTVFVYAASQLAANAGPDQQLCSTNPNTTLSGNSYTTPALGTWTVLQGNGVFANVNSPTTAVSGLLVGTNVFQWTINNGVCGPLTTDQITITVFNNAQLPANAGGDIEICSDQTSVALSGNTFSFPATALWTVSSGAGIFSDNDNNSTNVIGYSVGTNIYQYTIFNGPCSPSTSDLVTLTVNNNLQATAFAGNDQSLCLPQTSITLSGTAAPFPAAGLWTLISGTGFITTNTSNTTTVTGLSVGENIFRWTIDNSPCSPALTFDEVSIFVYSNVQSPADAGEDQDFCEPVSSTVLEANTPIFPATSQWTIVSGTGIFDNNTDPNTQVTGLSQGENTFLWTITNGPCVNPITSDAVSIFIYDDEQQEANAGEDQILCSPTNSTLLSGSSVIFPAVGTWTVISGSGIFVDENNSNTQVLGLSNTENIFQWTVDNGPCPFGITSDQVSIFVYTTTAPVADAGPDQEICTPEDQVTMAANNAVDPAVGTWFLVAGQGIIQSINNPNSLVTNLGVGENIFIWTINNGGCGFGSSSDMVSIFVFSDAAPDAFAGEDQDLCTPQSSTTLEGNLPVFPAFGEWTLVGGTGIISEPNNPNTEVTGLTIGDNVFQWTIYNGPCPNAVTSDIVEISVFDGGAPEAFAGDDQELCSPDSDTFLNADPAVFPGIGTWTVLSGTGTFLNSNSATTFVEDLSIGHNVFQWTLDYSTCGTQADIVDIIVYDSMQGEAEAGPDQEFCTPTSTSTLAADAVLNPGYGTWSVISGAAEVDEVNNPTSGVNNLSQGDNVLLWTVYNGPCLTTPLTTDTMVIYMFDNTQPPANAGIDQEYCTPTSLTTLTGNGYIYPASGLWQLVQGTGIINSPNNPNSIVGGLTVGENIFTWTIFNGPCDPPFTIDSISIFIHDATQPDADAGPDQQFCWPINSTALNGNSIIFPSEGTWTLLSGTAIISDIHDPNASMTGLTIGENIFEWTVENEPCNTTTDIVSIFIYDNTQFDADAGPDQELCLPTTSTSMSGSDYTFPGSGLWTLIQGTATIENPVSPTTNITGLEVGENIFVWTILNGPCANPLTTDTVSIFLFDDNAVVANAGDDQSFCEPVSSTSLTATQPDDPGVGTWTVISSPGPVVFADINDPLTEVSGLIVGETILLWTVYNGPCSNTNTTDLVTIFIYEEEQLPADAGDDQQFCSPVNSTILDGNTATFPGFGFWTTTQGSGVIVDASDPQSPINNLGFGINIFTWNISNGPCDPSFSSDDVMIEIFDNTQDDANAGEDQEICLPTVSTQLDGSEITTDASSGVWTIIQGFGNFVDATDPLTIVSDLPVGENIFQWTVDNGPCGTTNDQVRIFIYPEDGVAANAGEDISICTPQSCVTLDANTPDDPGVGTWTILQGFATISDLNNPNAEACGLGVGETILCWTIYNGPCAITNTMDCISIFVYDDFNELADAGPDQELCLPQTSTTMAASVPTFPAFGTWTLVTGCGNFSDVNDPGTTVSNLCVGENIFVWEIFNGPCTNSITTDTVSIFLYDDNASFANAGIDQEWCLPITTTLLNATTPQSPGVGTWTLTQGTGMIVSLNDPNSQVLGLSVGENIFCWNIYNGNCPNSNTVDYVSIFIFDDEQAAADAGPDQDVCVPGNATVQLDGNNVIFPADGTWTVAQGSGTFLNANDPNTVVSNVPPGCNLFVWTISNGPCDPSITTDTVQVCVFISTLAIANAGPDQEWCSPIDNTLLNGSALGGAATGLWTFVSGTGTIIDPTNPTTQIIDLEIGTNIFEWTVDNGPCGTTSDQVTINIFDPNAAVAAAGPDAFFCTPTSTFTMQGNTPAVPGEGTWILLTGTGAIQEENNPTTLITGLAVGENIFLWSIYNGPCAPPTVDVMSIFIYNENTPDADAGPDQEICLPDTDAIMDASPAQFPAIGTWALVDGTGNIVDVNNPNTTITGLSLGTNCFVWIVYNGSCIPSITTDTVCVMVFDPGVLPNAGPDQEICTPQSTVTMSGSIPQDPNYGFWTLIQGSATIDSVNDPNTTISGLAVGINIFSWSYYNGSCPDGNPSDEVTIFVFDQGQLPADSGVDQELCMPTTTASLNGNSVIVPAIGTWTLVNGSGDIMNPNDPNTQVMNLGIGTNTFMWTIDNGPCPGALTNDTVDIMVFPSDEQEADAGTDVEICTPTNCVTLNATPVNNPAVGTWEIISGNGSIDDLNDPNPEICNLIIGQTVLEWTVYNGPCANVTTDQMTIEIFDEFAQLADAGEDIEICAPDNQITMNASVPVFPGWGEWAITSGTGTIDNPDSPTTTISNLNVGVVVLQWYIYNGPCGESFDEITITINDPDSPNADAGPDQDFCDPPTSVQLDGNTPITPAYGTWTQIAGDTNVTFSDPNDPNATTSAPALNESAFVWTVYNGACDNGITTDTMWIYVNSSAVTDANAGPDQEFCGLQNIVQMQASSAVGLAVGTWSTISGGGDFADINEEQTEVTNVPFGINTYLWTMDNGICGTTSDEVVITIYDPDLAIAYAGESAAICEHEFLTFNLNASAVSPPATGSWTINEGPIELDDMNEPDALVLSLGEILVPLEDVISWMTWTVDNGVCGSSSDSVVFILEDCLTIKIPDAFSPNGDGTNDVFEIPNIENYENNNVQIFNRWGMKIYEAAPYLNGWDGTSTHSATIGDNLPVSTYYYVLDLGEGGAAYNGFIYLKR